MGRLTKCFLVLVRIQYSGKGSLAEGEGTDMGDMLCRVTAKWSLNVVPWESIELFKERPLLVEWGWVSLGH